MGKNYRQGRLGEEIRRIISELLLREIKDPRLSGMVSISAVNVTPDGSYATVYVSILGSEAEPESSDDEKNEVLAAFRSAKGLIKREIGRQVKLRHIPELVFKSDNSMEYGRYISKLINQLDIPKDESGEATDESEDEDEM